MQAGRLRYVPSAVRNVERIPGFFLPLVLVGDASFEEVGDLVFGVA